MSSFGGPGGGQKVARPTPPERGSFPLDHDGECKHIMAQYLRCLRAHRGENDAECRAVSKSYLQCRMDRNLMAHDEMRNLGFAEEVVVEPQKEQQEQGGGLAAPAAAAADALGYDGRRRRQQQRG